VDLAILAVLLAFLAWGVFHGALRQILGLVVLALAFAAAPWLGPRLEGTIRKLADLDPETLSVVAWATAFLGVAAAGAVVLHALRGPVSRARIGGRLDRWIGGLVGGAKGVVVVGLVAYGVLAWYSDREPPGVVRSLWSSRTAAILESASREVGPLLRLPPPVVRRVEEVNRRIDGGETGP
jgi:uncharacterized membrane protein required for colicin V production